MAEKEPPNLKAVEREARRLERLCKLRLVEPSQSAKVVALPRVDYEPKDAA
jgi:hypothetical protein